MGFIISGLVVLNVCLFVGLGGLVANLFLCLVLYLADLFGLFDAAPAAPAAPAALQLAGGGATCTNDVCREEERGFPNF